MAMIPTPKVGTVKRQNTMQITPGMLKHIRLGRKLVVYGKPGCGKTTLVVALLKAGKQVVYLDLDGNMEPLLQCTPDELALLTVLPLRSRPASGSAVQCLNTLAETGKFTVCEIHGEHKCPVCSKDDEAVILTYDLYRDMPLKAILVVDSYTQVHDDVINAVYAEHKLSNFDKAELPQFGAMARLDKVFTQLFLRSGFDCLVIAHAASSKPLLDKDARDSWYPVLGSANTTRTSMKSATVVAMISWNKPIVAETTLNAPYEVVLHQPLDSVKTMLPAAFVTQYFS